MAVRIQCRGSVGGRPPSRLHVHVLVVALLAQYALSASSKTKGSRTGTSALFEDAKSALIPNQVPAPSFNASAPGHCPLVGDPIHVTNDAIALLLPAGRLEDSLACFTLARERLVSDAPSSITEEVLEIITANADVVRRALLPWYPSARRLLHGWGTDPIVRPPLEAPLTLRTGPDAAIHVSHSEQVTPDVCASTIALFERSPLFEGNVMSAGKVLIDKKSKSRWEFDVSGEVNEHPVSEWAAIDRLMVGVVVGALASYEVANPHVRTLRNPFGDEGFRMIRYEPNATSPEHHAWHADGGQEALGSPPRVLAAIVYLSSPIAGGETLFLNQGIEVTPECGKVLIFPSAFPYVHAGRPVTKGRKYAMTLMITL